MQTATAFRQCRHIKNDGVCCGSPAVRGSDLCFFHDPLARERHEQNRLALRPDPTRLALRLLAESWPSQPLSRERRALLEYALQIAASLPK